MIFTWLKSYMPRSLLGRSVLILLFPVVILQLIVGLIFIQRHFAQVTHQMTHSVALELDYAVNAIENTNDTTQARLMLFSLTRPFDIGLDLQVNHAVKPGVRFRFYDISGREIIKTLKQRLKRPLFIDLATDETRVLVEIQTNKGVITANIPRTRVSATNPHQLLVLMVIASILLTVTSILFLRNQIKPIGELARASEAFGKGQSVPFRPGGASEVRLAGHSFLAMRRRLERQIEQRTQMLSGVSHDLRTPITRLKLSLAMLEPTEETQHMLDDVNEMERMLEGFLAFARGESLEAPENVDAKALFARIDSDWRRSGHALSYKFVQHDGTEPHINLRPEPVTRAVNNLLSNAFHHAEHVSMSVRVDKKQLVVIVEDDGPGINESEREEALKPFVRLDPARNQNVSGGVGLGLAITAEIAHSHGGLLELGTSETLGGLKATITIPR